MAAPTFFICHTTRKSKHLALEEIHYQLVNTSMIFTYASWSYCECDKFSGCRLKPRHRRLTTERNYCFICRTRITFNIDRIYKINKIRYIINNFLDLKEHLQLRIDFGNKIFWFYDFPKIKGYPCVINYIKSGFYDVVYNDL